MSDISDTGRFKLGIIFNFSPQWLGGVFYIINIIKTLDFLDDKDKPEVFLYYSSDLSKFLGAIDYPYLHTIEWEFPSIVKGQLKSWLLRKNLFIEELLKRNTLDALFPLQDYPVRTTTPVKLISWNADFQYKHYPEFFSRKQIFGRDLRTRLALKNTNDVVLSSEDAYSDLSRFFHVRKGLRVHIYHFVSLIDDLEQVNMDEIKVKYQLPDHYFLVSNQFHKHKNHRVLLLALASLKASGITKHLAITGKLPRATDSPYLAEIHRIIEDNELQDQISLLGVISRNEQLQIMRHAQAVLQPSLFEGWSTVIEDARSLQVPVVASNLDVNIEQLGKHNTYFDPHNPDELATILKNYPERDMNELFYEGYPKRIRDAAKTLLGIFKSK